MDGAPCCFVLIPAEERALTNHVPGRVLPVGDPDDAGQVFLSEIIPADPLPVRKADCDMLEDVCAVLFKPGPEVFNHPFLAPSPSLATPPALATDLAFRHDDHRYGRYTSPPGILLMVTVVTKARKKTGSTGPRFSAPASRPGAGGAAACRRTLFFSSVPGQHLSALVPGTIP